MNTVTKTKLVDVYGIKMSREEEMYFSKYISNNGIAMNTKTKDERMAIVLEWLEKHHAA